MPKDTIALIHDSGTQGRLELRAYGQSLRERSPCGAHGEWKPATNRPDPIDLLRAQDANRIAELIPVRYGRMVESPFRFYRGSAAIMSWDLAHTKTSGVNVQACGDAHIGNFGLYASPERRVIFDINDFDETLPAPWEFDVKRLGASIVLDCIGLGFDNDQARDALYAAISRYCKVMLNLADVSSLDIHYAAVDEHSFFETDRGKDMKKYARDNIRKARKRTRYQAFRKWCTDTGGRVRFVEDPPLLVRVTDEESERLRALFNRYRSTLQSDREHALREYQICDVARRVVGVGSVSLGAYAILLEGRGDHDPLIIQIKEATSSVLAPHVGASRYERHGQRIVEGQRLMQAASDPFLGWASSAGKEYYLRQIRDMKGKGDSPDDPALYLADVTVIGGTLARAHARSLDPALIAGYLGTGDEFVEGIVRFSFIYAEQAERDHARMLEAVRTGKVAVE